MATEFTGSIPHTMSTQHPDNASIPDWCEGEIIDGEAEIFEAYFAYSNLGCQEVMWDVEGKDVDTHVVRKLITKYPEYFKERILGQDFFLTYRIPNPRVESVEKKIVVETLQNIPIAFDAASKFYNKEVKPIFEVILPFTTSGEEIIWIYNYYKQGIVATENIRIDESLNVKEWIGAFKPKNIQVIPLVEDYTSLLNIDNIISKYIDLIKPNYMRVFIARSDPALNYGLIDAVLLSRIALAKLKRMEKVKDLEIHPIIGVGTMPFRGHLSPENVQQFIDENKGLSTVTIQSALRYDQEESTVKEVVRKLNNNLPNKDPSEIEVEEEAVLQSILSKCRTKYESVVEDLAPLINKIAEYVPPRRARRLHIGLFGYSRNVKGVNLPRAITFASTFYSLGIPPEFIGCRALEDLSEGEWDVLQKFYTGLKNDLRSVGSYISWQNVNMLMELLDTVEAIMKIKLGPATLKHRKHENYVNNFLISFLENSEEEAKKFLVESAKLRRCLG
jgi:phosphoenolpyruvate carboxylase